MGDNIVITVSMIPLMNVYEFRLFGSEESVTNTDVTKHVLRTGQ